MNKNINEKLNEILSYLLDNNVFNKFGITHIAKYWKMGTDIFNMLNRFFNKIKDKNINEYVHIIQNNDILTSQGNNSTFELRLNGENITPISNKIYSSKAAMHQYIRTFLAFSIGIIEENFEQYNEIIDNIKKFKLVHNAKFLLEEENRLFLIQKLIVDSLFSNIGDKRNFAYSILIELMIFYNYDFANLKETNRIFYWNKSIGPLNKKTIKCADVLLKNELIIKDIQKQGSKGTYLTIVKTIDNLYKNFDDFIDDIYSIFSDNLKDNINIHFFPSLQKQINEMNIKNQIKVERSRFKKNIFDHRRNLKLISDENDLYSDIIGEDDKYEGLLVKFKDGEAAHIFDVFKIKSILLSALYNQDMSNILQFISNPNNGVIMKIEYHKSFDRGQWTFDSCGNMIVPYENQKYLFEILKLKRIKIRKEILSNEMKEFITKR